MTKFKPTTHALIDQTIKECLYPKIEAGKTYYFKSPHGLVERPVVEVDGKKIIYRKPKGFGVCPLLTFQRLYQKYGVIEA